MLVLQTYRDIAWLPQPNKISEVLSSILPPIEQITTAFGLITYQSQILVANLYRGWDLPGGHVEEGESLLEALEREVYEETKVCIEHPIIVGYQKLEVYAEKPENYRYPYPESYQVHFHAEVKDICEFVEDQETKGRAFLPYEPVRKLPNLQYRMGLIQYALGRNRGKR